MRITKRPQGVKNYWESRWDQIPADAVMENSDSYPLKYSDMVINEGGVKILEAGCGAGRLLRHYHNRGFDIVGIDYIPIAIEKLKLTDASLNVRIGDITNLEFNDECFDVVLAFGLFHNLEHGLAQAISETKRVLKYGGVVVASFRADNIQTKFSDFISSRKLKNNKKSEMFFHKINLTDQEFKNLFINAGFSINYFSPVENMPFLYKFKFFRKKSHRFFNESKGRAEGYLLSPVGRLIQNILMPCFPNQFPISIY